MKKFVLALTQISIYRDLCHKLFIFVNNYTIMQIYSQKLFKTSSYLTISFELLPIILAIIL